mgnify:CR=1 FL=1
MQRRTGSGIELLERTEAGGTALEAVADSEVGSLCRRHRGRRNCLCLRCPLALYHCYTVQSYQIQECFVSAETKVIQQQFVPGTLSRGKAVGARGAHPRLGLRAAPNPSDTWTWTWYPWCSLGGPGVELFASRSLRSLRSELAYFELLPAFATPGALHAPRPQFL